MVPDTGPNSNTNGEFLAETGSSDKGIPDTPHQSLGMENCEDLFNTLAEWNSYLEHHVPQLSEEQDKSDHRGPQL